MDERPPTAADLIRRLDELETALERALVAFKEDLAALRRDLVRAENARRERPTTKPPRSPAPAPKRTISEEVRLTRKRDPRSE